MTKEDPLFPVWFGHRAAGGSCTGLVAYYTGMPMGAFSRARGPAELRYVPADATLVAYADVQDVMRSEFRQKLRAVMGHDEDGKQEFQKETGIDIEHDIDHVVAFSEPGSLQGKSYAGMVIASGRFDVAKLEALAREHDGKVEDYKGKRLLTVSGKDDDSEAHSMTVAFLEPGVVARGRGRRPSIARSIARAARASSTTTR